MNRDKITKVILVTLVFMLGLLLWAKAQDPGNIYFYTDQDDEGNIFAFFEQDNAFVAGDTIGVATPTTQLYHILTQEDIDTNEWEQTQYFELLRSDIEMILAEGVFFFRINDWYYRFTEEDNENLKKRLIKQLLKMEL